MSDEGLALGGQGQYVDCKIVGKPLASRPYDHGVSYQAEPMTDRHMMHYVNGSLSAIEDVSMDRMKAAIVKLRAEIKKHLGVE